MRIVVIVATGLWLAACSVRAQGPPEIVIDRSACSYCGMLVSERVYAAAYRTAGGEKRVFDDIGCLVAAAVRDGHRTARFWFHDADAGHWIDGTAAVFVTSPSLRTPMGGQVVAHATRASAGRTATRHQGTVLASLDSLFAAKGRSHD